MKKTIAVILAIITSLLIIPMGVHATDVGSVESGYTPDSGAIAVSTVAEFEAMTSGKSYYLTKDIDFSGKTYYGNIVKTLSFTLDGCGHSLTGITVIPKEGSSETAEINAGIFFEVTAGAVLKNLVVGSPSKPISMTAPVGGSAGALIAAAKKEFTLENIKVYGNIESVKTAGGLVGYVGAAGFTISNCEFNGTANATDGENGVGGIIGRMKNSKDTAQVINCTNYGTISSSGTRGVGGIVGLTESKIDIINCENRGTITTAGDYAGGILGRIAVSKTLNPINIKGCSNYGAVTALSTGKNKDGSISTTATINAGVGGIVGGTTAFAYIVDNTLLIEACMNYATIKTNGVSAAAILGKGVNSLDADAVFKIIIKNCGNVGSIEYGNTNDPVGTFVSVASTNLIGSLSISNSFNIGTTNSNNAYAAVYNMNGDPNKGDAIVNDFYFLSEEYSKAANTQNVSVSNASAYDADKFASGEVAYLLGADFGQKLGEDTHPVPNGAAVTMVGSQYVNVQTLSVAADRSAVPYIQKTAVDTEGKQSVRFIIAVDSETITLATSAEMTIAFKKAGTDDITYTLDNSEIRFFRSVKADGGIYLADDGVAILGAVVTGVLESAWESVSVNLVFKSDSGNTLQKLSVSASHTK